MRHSREGTHRADPTVTVTVLDYSPTDRRMKESATREQSVRHTQSSLCFAQSNESFTSLAVTLSLGAPHCSLNEKCDLSQNAVDRCVPSPFLFFLPSFLESSFLCGSKKKNKTKNKKNEISFCPAVTGYHSCDFHFLFLLQRSEGRVTLHSRHTHHISHHTLFKFLMSKSSRGSGESSAVPLQRGHMFVLFRPKGRNNNTRSHVHVRVVYSFALVLLLLCASHLTFSVPLLFFCSATCVRLI